MPGIIDLFGSAGGLVQHRSALLASHGFAAFSLAYFAYKDLPPSLDTSIELDYFEVGFTSLYSNYNWLRYL